MTGAGVNKWVVAHELGHSSGIQRHKLIDYENGAEIDLEENSVMDNPAGTALTDDTFMMEMQGQIMLEHLGEVGTPN